MPLVVVVAALAVASALPVLWWSLAGDRQGVSRPSGLALAPAPVADLRQAELARSAVERLVRPTMAGLARRARRITPTGFVDALDRRIQLAGRSAVWPVERVLAAKLLAAGAVAAFLGVRWLLAPSARNLVVLVTLLLVTYLLPDVALRSLAERRQDEIRRALPDLLDQVTITVEAGLGFEAALARAGRTGTGPLAAEIVRTIQDIQLGIPRSQAMKNLLRRTDVPELRHFVTAIGQAEQYGVPIASVLRVQAAELREKRRQRAEETAMKIPVKVMMPVVLCILPALFVVVIGPAVVRISQAGFGG